ncbi:hypothetical protein [Brachyspira hampsonii]|uniref:Uncharacterized protein n=1 Tax=Brachyspira hampsonii TaxID=1287055 RepID=A0AAC9TS69_9SPIR|nr:hypothetical protein [Brachyspira hampsonii]ASJ20821.1 hypothetical protein BHAMNSH16_03830 [Brachyspira hampsonii]ELV05148.1 hypothetical protein H263_11969 [Brachyspira hampsonii 30599]OEJ17914.1 hypothetical protein A9496_09560 [Brachyspira hampsonii]
MSSKDLQLISDKLNELISYLENNDLDNFFKHKDEFCNLIILENSDSINDNIKLDIENIVPSNLMNTFINFIKYTRALRTMNHNDNDYTRYTLDNMQFIKTQIFKDY